VNIAKSIAGNISINADNTMGARCCFEFYVLTGAMGFKASSILKLLQMLRMDIVQYRHFPYSWLGELDK
jgi:hypothetical protein